MTNRMSGRFPAILVGGPPHAGKSVLSYSLKEALREAGLQCYLLRAAPDGEGDWSQASEQQVAQDLRRKGQYTTTWIEQMCRDIAYRPLPFLVDVGGKPKPWQEAIFDHCTHAILLTTDAQSYDYWQAMADKYKLAVIASLTSQLEGPSRLEATVPAIKGVITNLKRGQKAQGPVFEAIVERVKTLFNYGYDELLTIHQELSPTDLVIDLPKLQRRLNPARPNVMWQPEDLARVLEYIPKDTPLALYGIGPAWLYMTVACYIVPHDFYQFDARRGWVTPVSINRSKDAGSLVKITAEKTENYLKLNLDLSEDYLEYQPQISLPLPQQSTEKGLILSGKLPLWLLTGLALYYYRQVSWLALYYPQLNKSVVVATQDVTGGYAIGDLIGS